jgi:hypothetical protein
MTRASLLTALANEHDRRAYEIVRAFLEKHCEGLRVARVDIAAYLVVTSVRYATLCWARDQPEFDRKRFIDEVCDLVIGYLLGTPLAGVAFDQS